MLHSNKKYILTTIKYEFHSIKNFSSLQKITRVKINSEIFHLFNIRLKMGNKFYIINTIIIYSHLKKRSSPAGEFRQKCINCMRHLYRTDFISFMMFSMLDTTRTAIVHNFYFE